MKVIEQFLVPHSCIYTLSDLMDDVCHEIQNSHTNKENALLRMFKSDLRNIVKKYEAFESILMMPE